MSGALGHAGSIDPELLRSRLCSVADREWRARLTAVVEGALVCVGHFSGIDFLGLEREAGVRAPRELWGAVEGAVADMWLAVEELQQAMLPLVRAHEKSLPPALDNDLDIELEELSEASAPTRVPAPEERTAETAWAMAFVLSGEIDGFRRRLPALLRVTDGWELIGAVQDHVGHMRAAVNAVVTGIFTSLPDSGGGSALGDEQNLELVIARELRSRIFELRDHLLSIENEMGELSPAGWHPLLVRVHELIEAFMFSPAFAWMRANDKRAFLNHQRAVAGLLELWTPLRAEPARRVVGSAARYLEALEIINQRECLMLHDKGALERVIANLDAARTQAGASARDLIGKGLAALADAQGRDSRLDELLAQTLMPGTPVPIERIVARAREVMAALGGAGFR